MEKQDCPKGGKHDWQPYALNFQRADAVMCLKCGRTEERTLTTVTTINNPNFPVDVFPDIHTEEGVKKWMEMHPYKKENEGALYKRIFSDGFWDVKDEEGAKAVEEILDEAKQDILEQLSKVSITNPILVDDLIELRIRIKKWFGDVK